MNKCCRLALIVVRVFEDRLLVLDTGSHKPDSLVYRRSQSNAMSPTPIVNSKFSGTFKSIEWPSAGFTATILGRVVVVVVEVEVEVVEVVEVVTTIMFAVFWTLQFPDGFEAYTVMLWLPSRFGVTFKVSCLNVPFSMSPRDLVRESGVESPADN